MKFVDFSAWGPSGAIEGHRGPSRAIGGHRGPSGAIGGRQGPSRGHRGPSRGHRGPSRAVGGHTGAVEGRRGHAGADGPKFTFHRPVLYESGDRIHKKKNSTHKKRTHLTTNFFFLIS
jgi:hypothetical protein